MSSNWTKTAPGLILWNKPLISDGEQNWGSRLSLSAEAQSILSPSHFQATNGVEYRLGILPGYLFPGRRRRTTDHIDTFAYECILYGWKLHSPHLEVAGLAREVITDDDILAIGQNRLIFMHFLVPLGGGRYSDRLVTNSWSGRRCLSTCSTEPGFRYDRGDGFVFCVSKVTFEN